MPIKRRTYNVQLIKETWPYTVQEIAALYHLHKNAVLRWVNKEGLELTERRKPYLIRGSVLKAFLRRRQQTRKQVCAPDQLYCCKCRMPRKPFQRSVELILLTSGLVRLTGRCETCNAKMNKTQAAKKLPVLRQIFQIRTEEPRHLSPCSNPTVNSDMKAEDETG